MSTGRFKYSWCFVVKKIKFKGFCLLLRYHLLILKIFLKPSSQSLLRLSYSPRRLFRKPPIILKILPAFSRIFPVSNKGQTLEKIDQWQILNNLSTLISKCFPFPRFKLGTPYSFTNACPPGEKNTVREGASRTQLPRTPWSGKLTDAEIFGSHVLEITLYPPSVSIYGSQILLAKLVEGHNWKWN